MKKLIIALLNFPQYKADFLRELDKKIINHARDIGTPYSEARWNMYERIWLIRLCKLTGYITAYKLRMPTPTYRCGVTLKGVSYMTWQQCYTLLALIIFWLKFLAIIAVLTVLLYL